MNELVKEKTSTTPLVNFNPISGEFKIDGRSIPENPGEFYDAVIGWLVAYFKKPASKTALTINLEYVNSGSSKYLLGVFRVFKEAFAANNDVEIRWYYEEDDEAIESLGDHYKTISGVPFRLVEYI